MFIWKAVGDSDSSARYKPFPQISIIELVSAVSMTHRATMATFKGNTPGWSKLELSFKMAKSKKIGKSIHPSNNLVRTRYDILTTTCLILHCGYWILINSLTPYPVVPLLRLKQTHFGAWQVILKTNSSIYMKFAVYIYGLRYTSCNKLCPDSVHSYEQIQGLSVITGGWTFSYSDQIQVVNIISCMFLKIQVMGSSHSAQNLTVSMCYCPLCR